MATVLDREPIGVSLAIAEAGVAIVEQMAQFVEQDVVQVIVANRFGGPDELPATGTGLLPLTPVHAGFDLLSRRRWATKVLDQPLLHRIQVDGAAPLHPVAREGLFLRGHAAELHDLQRPDQFGRKLCQASPDIGFTYHMHESGAWILNDHSVVARVRFLRLMPGFRGKM